MVSVSLSVYLYGYRSFLITDIQLLFGLADGAYQGIGRYEFRVHHVAPNFLHINRNAGSVTSSIGAKNMGRSPKSMWPIFMNRLN